MRSSYGRSWGMRERRWWTIAMSHSVCFTSFSLCNTIWGADGQVGGLNTRVWTVAAMTANINECVSVVGLGTTREGVWTLWLLSYPLVVCSHRSSEVDGHQRVRRQKEVVEPQGVFGLWQHMTKPGNKPGQSKDGPHLRPEGRTGTKRRSEELQQNLALSECLSSDEIRC